MNALAKRLLALTLPLLACGTAVADEARVVCHDPSIFMDAVTNGTPQSPVYYIYGSHLGRGKTSADVNYSRWTTFGTGEEDAGRLNSLFANQSGSLINYTGAYNTHAITKVKNYQGEEVKFGNFNAHEWQYKGDNIRGNQWAPDVIYNKQMKKWCMYMSINGDHWCSSIVCLTSDNPEGPWVYQGPVVFSGFQGTYNHNGFEKESDYKYTDLEIAIGKQASLPERYKKADKWGEYWPNCIDPCVFYDQEGKLWMSYGSWSGGIFMLRLNEENGLRDYQYTYQEEFSSGNDYRNCISDPYFGRKIAGGWYVSGEASYIEYINGYYYLFLSYGGLVADGGYQMRIFRSEKPDGPYVDCNNQNGISAIYDKAVYPNYGADAKRDEGVKIMGQYQWPSMTVAELAQGHNSAIVDHKGRALLVYHTRFNNGTEGHQVRVHQLFQNEDGWLVAAPFEFAGETPNTQDVCTKELYTADQVAGSYMLIWHPYRQNTAAKAFEVPVNAKLNADGTVTGTYTGSWELVKGTSFINITLKGAATNKKAVTFKGVLTEQTITFTKEKALCFTALSSSDGEATSAGAGLQTRALSVWGCKGSVEEIEAQLYYPECGAEKLNNAWWKEFSDTYTLPMGSAVQFQFYNYSDKKENWHNWALYGCTKFTGTAMKNEFFGIRADNWDNTLGSNAGCTSNYNWDTFKADMHESHVEMTCTYSVMGKFDMSCTITTKAGKVYNYSYTKNITAKPKELVLFFTTECARISTIAPDGSSLGIEDLDAADPFEDNQTYDLFGRPLNGLQKGLNVRNGRVFIVR